MSDPYLYCSMFCGSVYLRLKPWACACGRISVTESPPFPFATYSEFRKLAVKLLLRLRRSILTDDEGTMSLGIIIQECLVDKLVHVFRADGLDKADLPVRADVEGEERRMHIILDGDKGGAYNSVTGRLLC